MNGDFISYTIFGMGLLLSVLALPCEGQDHCANAISFETLKLDLHNKPLSDVLRNLGTDRVKFLWCPEYDQTLPKGKNGTLSPKDIDDLRGAVDQKYCVPEKIDQLIRLRGSSTIGYTLAPRLAYKYLDYLKASGLRIIVDCDGKHSRVIGNHDGWIVFDIVATESEKGGADLVERRAEIAMSSKRLDNIPRMFEEVTIAQDEMAVIVNKLNPLERINIEELQGIVSGTLTKWRDMNSAISCGGSDTIAFYSRRRGSGTLSEFLNAIELNDSQFNPDSLPTDRIAKNHLEMAYKVAKDGCGLGYVSKPYAEMAKPIAVVFSKKVGLSRELYFYHGKRDYYSVDIGKTVESFIQYSMDKQQGQRDVTDLGYDANSPTPISEGNFGRQSRIPSNGQRIGRSIQFSPNSTVIDSAELIQLKELMGNIPASAREILFVGYTDNVGTHATNQVLSQERANAVARRFPASKQPSLKIGCGVRASGNDTIAGRKANRAVEVWWR